MDGAALSRFPHLSWLGYHFEVEPGTPCTCSWSLHQAAHALHFVIDGGGPVSWIHRGKEVRYAMRANSFHYLPADQDRHGIVANVPQGVRSYTLFLPMRHLDEAVAAENMGRRVEYQRLLVHDDPILRACMLRLANRVPEHDGNHHHEMDEVARRLVLRLVRLSGGGTPDWHDDASVFDQRTLRHLVEHVDAHLKVAPSLDELARRVGLSPSHFARKFRQSTGLSLHRFVNRRRICASLELLKDQSVSLAHAALDLGFSSQSHFTRLFSDLTSMTPARYQKQFKRVMCRQGVATRPAWVPVARE